VTRVADITVTNNTDGWSTFLSPGALYVTIDTRSVEETLAMTRIPTTNDTRDIMHECRYVLRWR